MKNLVLTAFFIGCAVGAIAQVNVDGRVIDENNQPLSFATVALLSARDSQLVKGAMTNTAGVYHIEAVSPGEYRLTARLVGYETTFSAPFSVQTDSKNASADLTLRPVSTTLKEAVVTAQRQLFEQKADRLVMNVANSPMVAGGTALEMLQKMPGVIVIQDRITVAGSQNVQIFIDGKPSQYADMNQVLRDLPGDQIDRVELITQPGAKYDAAGGTVLNVVLKRNANLGFSGTANLTLGGSRYDQNFVQQGLRNYARFSPSVSLNYRNGYWNLFGNYSFLHRSMFNIMTVERLIGDERYAQQNYSPFDVNVQNSRVGAVFFASKKTTVGVLLRGFDRRGGGLSSNVTEVFDRSTERSLGSFTTENDNANRRFNVAGNLNLKHEFDPKTGHALNIDVDYSTFDLRESAFLTIYQNRPGSTRSRSEQQVDQPIRIAVGQVDYTLPIDSTFKAEMGAKTSFATIDNKLVFLNNGRRNEEQSNDFLYRENINAGYVNLSKKLGKFDLNAGLRTEQTVVDGTSMGVRALERNYWQWFPSASALFHLNKHLGIQGAFSRRVNRPGFYQQNPFSQFIDSLTFQQGNPALLPEVTSNGQVALTFDNQPFVRVSYSRTDDVIIENAPRLEGTKTFTVPQNLAQYDRWAFELNFPLKYKKILDGFGGNQFIHNQYNATYLNTPVQRSKWNWMAYFQANVNLPRDIKVEFGGWYMTNFIEEFLDIRSMGGLNAGISKTFADKRGKLTLSVSDLLYSQQSNVAIDFANVLVAFRQLNDSRNARLTFSYTFGNTKLKTARRRSTGAEAETQRVKVE